MKFYPKRRRGVGQLLEVVGAVDDQGEMLSAVLTLKSGDRLRVGISRDTLARDWTPAPPDGPNIPQGREPRDRGRWRRKRRQSP